ncbi:MULTISPECIES: allophanate hydrolase subunit 1 [unclassified Streptomyces]|uniref:5-oxoprolinase subunit B family protein n=1 Tax=unclassified Streptomyces TaxID=2593676 RepID=UPI002DDABD35|nr:MULTISPECIES: allophanate hydrolase subunit 1 [unclassified Streptomyces]WSA96446.1 allophanate hydrolase subunit 1 [Streptomyces sp. NBC_01795]WSB80858.1 allophanate hydrolase subunit 1 [Streptomyces sp. NBC_01775]WSS39634.1 allophanate hydrolase subunit 1 [Streptomyces sp. NBC_01187]
MKANLTITDCGDSALMAKAVGSDEAHSWQLVHALADALDALRLEDVYGVVPTYDSLLVEFDCTGTDHDTVRRVLWHEAARIEAQPRRAVPAKRFVVPVAYGGEYGPDLPVVAGQLGLTESEVVRIHSACDLTVRCLGAPAGAPMMDGPPFPGPVPRLASPRTRVEPGCVAVAGRQAVICPMPSPGGWPLLGRTPLRVLDLHSDPLTCYLPGDVFRFVPIRHEEWDTYAGASLADAHG